MTILKSTSRDALVLDNRVFTDLDNLVVICAHANASNYSSFRQETGTAYQVATGTTLKIKAFKIHDQATGAYIGFLPGYGDDAVWHSGSAPTNAQWALGLTPTTEVLFTPRSESATWIWQNNHAYPFDVPATKYPAAFINGGQAAIWAFGYAE